MIDVGSVGILGAVGLAAGASIGSFAAVSIERKREGASILWPPSSCPSCQRRLKAWENVPIFAFAILRGRCRTCKGRIDPITWYAECAGGIIGLTVGAVAAAMLEI